jgi:hypothetical protein
MSRSRRTPFLFALVAGAAAWLAWRFVPRDWLDRCCGTGRGAARSTGAGTPDHGAPRPRAARPQAAPAGSAAARVVDPAGGEPATGDGDEASAAPGATQAEDPARCAAVTQSGSRCSREAEPGSTRCWQHGGG